MNTLLQMYLSDHMGNRIMYAGVPDVDTARRYWTQIAAVADSELSGFDVADDTGAVLYTGDYATDEC